MEAATAKAQLSGVKAGMRRLAVPLSAPLLPGRIRANAGGLQRAGFLASRGMGVLVLINHFSLRDGLDTFRLLFTNPALRQLPMLAPAASHLIDRRVRLLTALFAVDVSPITTPEAVANLGLAPAAAKMRWPTVRRRSHSCAAGASCCWRRRRAGAPAWRRRRGCARSASCWPRRSASG
jgi:hypothetical protein